MSDFISRQAAIDVLTHFTNLSWDKLKIMYPMLTMIEELPSAERHGRWNELPYSHECSVCGIIRPKEMTGKWHYCPHCGAHMIEEETK